MKMIELPKTNPYWHTDVDLCPPLQRPEHFVLHIDLTKPTALVYWHTHVAAVLEAIADGMMEGDNIPTHRAFPSFCGIEANIAITGESEHKEHTWIDDPLKKGPEKVTIEEFSNYLNQIVATKRDDGSISLSLPKKNLDSNREKGGEQ